MEMTSTVHIIFDNACTNDITQSCPHKHWNIPCATGKIMLQRFVEKSCFRKGCVSLSVYNFITSL